MNLIKTEGPEGQ